MAAAHQVATIPALFVVNRFSTIPNNPVPYNQFALRLAEAALPVKRVFLRKLGFIDER